MFEKIRTAATACLLALLFSSPSEAMPGRIGRGVLSVLPEAGRLSDGSFTPGPRAFQTFCDTYQDQCSASAPLEPVKLDETRWSMLEEVNSSVNRRIVAQSDTEGTDTWTLDVGAGDCDDYAVEKRKKLIDRGWPITALSLAVARVSSGEAHLLLTVRTDHGDFVLDNLHDRVSPAQQVGYHWIARQSSLHPRLWVRIDGVRRHPSQNLVAKTDEHTRGQARSIATAARIELPKPAPNARRSVAEPVSSERAPTAPATSEVPNPEAGTPRIEAGIAERLEFAALVE